MGEVMSLGDTLLKVPSGVVIAKGVTSLPQGGGAELQRQVDVEGLARAVPPGLEPPVHMVSPGAINLDQRAEADYLHQLAGALDLSPDQVNAIDDKVRAPRLYR